MKMNNMKMSGHNRKGMKMSPKSNMNHMNMQSDPQMHGMDMSNMKGMHGMPGMNMSGSSNDMQMKGNHMLMKMPGGVMMDMTGLKQKFWLSLILTIPIIFMSSFMGIRLPFQITFPGSDWVVAVISSILFFYCGLPFFNGARGEIKLHRPAMMSLISMGITVAYGYSIYAVIANDLLNATPKVNDFFVELATLIVIMLLGHWVEMDTVMNAGSAVDKLAKLLPDTAHLVKSNGQLQDVKVNELKPGNQVLIKAGEKIPADGNVIKGSTMVNESLVTGESKQIQKKANNQVIGGSINNTGSIRVKITGTGKSGFLAKVMGLVSSAQSHKSKKENLANRVSGYLFYAALAAAAIAFISWLAVHGISYAIMMAVSALVIACPHALGLAVPLVVSRTTSLAATHGLLIRNRDALEDIDHIQYALMDKTGTLTQGKFKINDLRSLDPHYSRQQILKILGSLEQNSTHPLATGILNQTKADNIKLVPSRDVKQITGLGIQGTVNNQNYAIVAHKYLDQHQIKYDDHLFKRLAAHGNSVSYLITDHQVIGIVAEGDQIKAGSKKLIQYLRSRKIKPIMLTGDNPAVAKKVAQNLGGINFKANLLPKDKQNIVSEYQQKGAVIFIGDGINDAPSLAKAEIGIAIGSGTDVAIDSADAVLVNSDPEDVINLINLAHHSNAKMIENLWWGAGYNIVAIPLAAGLLAFAGIVITPTVGAIIMSLSTVVVAINAMTLKIH